MLMNVPLCLYWLISFILVHSGELRSMYRLVPIAVVGGSFLPGLTGHNISEAAAAGCAILTGMYYTLYAICCLSFNL